jgi:hypothetical protein
MKIEIKEENISGYPHAEIKIDGKSILCIWDNGSSYHLVIHKGKVDTLDNKVASLEVNKSEVE